MEECVGVPGTGEEIWDKECVFIDKPFHSGKAATQDTTNA